MSSKERDVSRPMTIVLRSLLVAALVIWCEAVNQPFGGCGIRATLLCNIRLQ